LTCESCERMTRAETKIKNLEELTGGMDKKVDQLMLDFARAKNALLLLNIMSPIAVGLIVYIVTKG
jgi:hypothetical protein